MHTFRDFRALRVDTDQVSSAELIQNSTFETGQLVRDQESGYYLYEMAKWRDSGPGLRIMGIFGILELHKSPSRAEHSELFDESIATAESDFSKHIFPHEQTLSDTASSSSIAPSLTRDGAGPIWAIADTDIVDMVGPNKLGPIARATDGDGVAHRLYGLPQPSVIEIIREAIQDCELVLADGHHRIRAAIDLLADRPAGAKVELLCFICQAKDVSGIVRPIHRAFSGPSVAKLLEGVSRAIETTEVKPETPHVELLSSTHSLYVPIAKTVSGTIAQLEKYFVDRQGTEIEYITSVAELIERVAASGAIGMKCPAIPVAEIIYSAKKRRPLMPKSTLFYPKPIPAMILGEDRY